MSGWNSAPWLGLRGDQPRAEFLRALNAKLVEGDIGDLPELPGAYAEWARLMGGPLLQTLRDVGLFDHRHEILHLVRPALRVRQTSPLAHDRELETGRSKLWGHPDLHAGGVWPRHRECTSHLMGDDVLPEETCGFIGQLNLDDINQTVCAGTLPGTGLLTIFAFSDMDQAEAVGLAISLARDPSNLVRVPPPGSLLELNDARAPIAIQLEEVLRLPELDGPHGETLRARGVDASAYHELQQRGYRGGPREFFGYATATTGGDPTESSEWRQLAWLETPGGIGLHLQIKETDLRAGAVGATKIAWVDFD